MSDVVCPGCPSWGEFQSLAQLSVGLNGAFSAIAGFVSGDFVRERAEINYLLGIIERNPQGGKAYNKKIKGIRVNTYSKSLLAECDAIERQTEFLLTAIIRPLCILGAIAGMMFLVISSFLFKDPISNANIYLLIATNIPFFAGLLIVIVTSLRLYMKVRRYRLTVSDIVRQADVTGTEE